MSSRRPIVISLGGVEHHLTVDEFKAAAAATLATNGLHIISTKQKTVLDAMAKVSRLRLVLCPSSSGFHAPSQAELKKRGL